MSARENILRRIREKSGRSGATSDAEMQSVRAHIAEKVRGPLPSIAGDEPVARFIRECDRLKTTAAEVASREGVPQEVARYLSQNALERRVVGWASLSGLNWPASGIRYDNRIANGDDLVGITDCFCAIGETGTLLLLSSQATPKLNALLPETHICVVSKSRIVGTMEDAFALLRAEVGALPRSTFFVSGPSRTADIEQTIVIGAHGPYRVHVVLIP